MVRHTRITLLALTLSWSIATDMACAGRWAPALPPQLGDAEFWDLGTALSDPPGEFRHSDNLVSNEDLYAHSIRLLRPRPGVYIGVGPEQNFSFIARLQPSMAFIIDIRQENRHLHLLYKALFESSADRAEFLSRLFSREQRPGIDAGSSVDELFTALESSRPSASLHDTTTRQVRERLLDVHRFPLSAADLESIAGVLHAFYTDGPGIHYARARPKDAPGPSYRSLMTAVDARGVARSYLATEKLFAFVKDLHARNLIVPVVGDFGGTGAIRRVGDYIRQQGSVVSAFYSSNVEVYLTKQRMAVFCESLADLPYESRTWYIRSKDVRPLTAKLRTCRPAELDSTATSGR